jgi:hypothetical protein
MRLVGGGCNGVAPTAQRREAGERAQQPERT